MTTKVRESTLDVPLGPGTVGVIGGPLVIVNTANTVDLRVLSATTQNIAFTGTTSIAGFQILEGQTYFCTALSNFRLLYSTLLATPTSKDISVQLGDSFVIRATSANVVQVLLYTRSATANTTQPACCRLDLDSGTGNLVLRRFNGVSIPINGSEEIIPGAAVTLAPTGLIPDTVYYIYAYMSGTNMLLEASTTGYTKSTITGVEIKIADATRTLVGMVRPVTGPLFADSLTQRLVISWYNRKKAVCTRYMSSDVTVTGNSFVALTAPIEFLNFESVQPQHNAIFHLSTDTANALSVTCLDGAPPYFYVDTVASTVDVYSTGVLAVSSVEYNPGYNTVTLFGAGDASAASTTWSSTRLSLLSVDVEI